jgi:hypothetical protein
MVDAVHHRRLRSSSSESGISRDVALHADTAAVELACAAVADNDGQGRAAAAADALYRIATHEAAAQVRDRRTNSPARSDTDPDTEVKKKAVYRAEP